jgi:hypothetical protein
VGASALALQRWYLVPLLLPPLVAAWWGFRSGTDADSASVRVRGLLGSRAVAWGDVAGFRVQGRRVLMGLVRGGELPLPAVAPADLPTLIATSGHPIEPQTAPAPDGETEA